MVRRPKHTFTSSGNFEVTLTVQEADGSTATVSRTITVNLLPTIDFLIDDATDDQCDGTSQLFRNTSAPAGLEFLWDFGDGSPTTNAMDPIHDFPGPGTYTVTLTGTNPTTGCHGRPIERSNYHAFTHFGLRF